METITYLKLGGSLITDKKIPHTPRMEIIEQAVDEIKRSMVEGFPGKLIIGHGSGSYGHVPAKNYQTHAGVHDPTEWKGFVEVWNEAHALNQIMVEAFRKAKLPVMVFSPSAMITTANRRISTWDLSPIKLAVLNGIIPLVHGDVVFDSILGGTILSTEEIFAELANHLAPTRVLLAGVENGVWQDFPKCTRLINKIDKNDINNINRIAGGSDATDVTGGMQQKIRILVDMIERDPACTGQIFSGMKPGSITAALRGDHIGTLVSSH